MPMTLLEAIASYLLRKSIHNDTSSHIKNTRSRDMFMIYVLVVWGPNDSPLNEGGRRNRFQSTVLRFTAKSRWTMNALLCKIHLWRSKFRFRSAVSLKRNHMKPCD